MPLGAAIKQGIPAEHRNPLGQALWDFYQYQIHELHEVHADPHPGNFIVTPDHQLGIIDFGCVKEMTEDFYTTYFQLLDPTLLKDPMRIKKVFDDLRFIHEDDTEEEILFFTSLFSQMVELLGRPFHTDTFDFGDTRYFEALYAFGEKLAGMKELRQSKKVRGLRDALYINRTYFGLYSLLHEMKSEIRVR